MMLRISRAVAVLLLVSVSAFARAASPEYGRAMEKARQAIAAFQSKEARDWLDVALSTAASPDERARALDLLGGLEGIETHYALAFRNFFAAARLSGAGSVAGTEHPQTATRLLARCAVELAEGGLQPLEAEARIRVENGIRAGVALDEGLRDTLFGETFVCPKVEKVELPMAVAREPAPALVGGEESPGVEASADDPGGFLRPPPVSTWILGGVALAAAGTGGVLAGVAWDEANALRAPNFASDLDAVEGKLTAASVAYATAGVAAVGAILFWVLDNGEEDSAAAVDVGPGAFAVRF